jgi:hypothetical protein
MRKPKKGLQALAEWEKAGGTELQGKAFKPWLTVRDVPSSAPVCRLYGQTTGRVHHLMSGLEKAYCLLFDWHPHVVDIREQFPLLPVQRTQQIAEELGITPPRLPGTNESYVMTCDFLLTIRTPFGPRYLAQTVKPATELAKPRVLEKLEIERRFWHWKKIPFGVVTDRGLPADLVWNLDFVSAFSDPYVVAEQLGTYTIDQLLDLLGAALWRASSEPLGSVCHRVEQQLALAAGVGLMLVRHAIASGAWHVDLSCRLDPSRPLQLRQARSGAGALSPVVSDVDHASGSEGSNPALMETLLPDPQEAA